MPHELWQYCWCDECKERRALAKLDDQFSIFLGPKNPEAAAFDRILDAEIMKGLEEKHPGDFGYCGHNDHLYCQREGCGMCVTSLGTYVDAEHHKQEVANLEERIESCLKANSALIREREQLRGAIKAYRSDYAAVVTQRDKAMAVLYQLKATIKEKLGD